MMVAVSVFVSFFMDMSMPVSVAMTVLVMMMMVSMSVAVSVAVSVTVSVTVSMVMMMSATAVENLSHYKVTGEPYSCGYQHDLSVYIASMDYSLNGFEYQPNCKPPDEDDTSKSPNNLCAVVAESHGLISALSSDPDREDANQESRKVREEVRGICHDGHAVCKVASDDLNRHKRDAHDAHYDEFFYRELGFLSLLCKNIVLLLLVIL